MVDEKGKPLTELGELKQSILSVYKNHNDAVNFLKSKYTNVEYLGAHIYRVSNHPLDIQYREILHRYIQ